MGIFFEAVEPRRLSWRRPLVRGTSGLTWEHLRFAFFLAVMMLLWMFPNPNATSFSDDPNAGREGSLLIQVLWFGLLVFGMGVTRERFHDVRRQIDLTLLLMLGWCALSSAFALVPDVSIRRLILTVVCMAVIGLMFGGIRSLKSVLWLLLVMCIVETAMKYFFVFAIPHLGRHTTDGLEPHLSGLWRGQYFHKNTAGPVCAIEIAILYAARRSAPFYLLFPLALLQVLFLFFSGSKTPLILIFATMLMTKLVLSLRSGTTIAATVLGALAFLNTVTLASVVSDDARELAADIIGDVTFTGRVELWRFLMHYTADYPLIGAGFQSFWQIGNLSPAVTRGNSWTSTAVYGHQGFLDTVVMIGIPGLILTIIFVVVRPALDLGSVRDRTNPILEMFVTFWLFGLFENGTESVLLARADQVWLFLVAGIVGIRRSRMAKQSGGDWSSASPVGRRPNALKNWSGFSAASAKPSHVMRALRPK